MKHTFQFPIGRLTPANQIKALNIIKEEYYDATCDFTAPYKITSTLHTMSTEGDAQFSFGLLIGKVISDLLHEQLIEA